MAEKKKRKRNEYRLVALCAEPPGEDPIIFVSQTRMPDLKKLFSYYKRECEYTKEFFEPGITPELFLLEDKKFTKAGAYLHRIAWARYFVEKEYDVAGDLKVYEDGLDLYGVAACIYEDLSKIPLEEVMGRRQTHTPEKLDKEEVQEGPPMKKPGPLTERLSIRLNGPEHRAFLDYCDEHGLSQREGLQMLLSGASDDGKYKRTLAMEQNYRIKKMEEEIARLQKVPRSIPEYDNLKEAFRFAKQGVLRYIDTHAEKPPIIEKPMGCTQWEEMQRTIPQNREYVYPQQDGDFVFRLEMMCYGHGDYSAVFFWGVNCDTGKPIRLRYYLERFYCGVNPHNSNFFVKGMYFLVGCRRLFPDVTELVTAFPLLERYMEEQQNHEGEEPAEGVEALIADAQWRSQNEY